MENEQNEEVARDPITPDSYTGVYSPVYAGAALQSFINGANFGTVDPVTETGALLSSSLPLAKSGYLMKNTTTMLLYLHSYVEDLLIRDKPQCTRSSEAMTNAFGGLIPAEFFRRRVFDENQQIATTSVRFRMQDTTAQKINTYQAIKSRDQEFDPECFKTYFFQNIISLNLYTVPDLFRDSNLAKMVNHLEDPTIRAGMLAEHKLIKDVCKVWQQIRNDRRRD